MCIMCRSWYAGNIGRRAELGMIRRQPERIMRQDGEEECMTSHDDDKLCMDPRMEDRTKTLEKTRVHGQGETHDATHEKD